MTLLKMLKLGRFRWVVIYLLRKKKIDALSTITFHAKIYRNSKKVVILKNKYSFINFNFFLRKQMGKH